MSENVQTKRRPAVMSHAIRRGIPIIVLLAVVAGAYLYWRKVDSSPKHEAAAAPQGPIPVTVVTVREETVPIKPRFLGQTEGTGMVEIRARVNGYIEERAFKEGSRVEKGQKLYQIDPRPFQVELAQAKARLASAQATQQRAAQQLKRYEQLSARGSATPGELEEWQKEEGVGAAQVQLAKAQIASAELQLSYTTIESPITGMIGRALKEPGNYVDAGANGLVAVVQQVDPITVRFPVTEKEMLRFRQQVAERQLVGPEEGEAELEITLANGRKHPHKGRVNFVDVQVDLTTGTSLVKGEVPSPDGTVKPGQFIYVNVLGYQRVNVIRVPQKAVLQSPAGASVFVVNDKGLVEVRPVTLGEWSGEDQWIVERGIKPGDRVITDRLMMVRPGMPVAIAASTPSGDPAQGTTARPSSPKSATNTPTTTTARN